ncbi:hypothetical protein F5B21DRAFT_454954 [Xylaria acuta]|nr:hypothetical protein F5B21DRAFT_454954 [Xylaria acuta]
MSGSALPIPKSDGQYGAEKRWPKKRGGYKIEKQCSVCTWWFDSFDPERKMCHLCLEGNPQQPPVTASMPDPTVQQSEVPQELLDSLQLFDVPVVGNTQLDNTQYHACGQGFGATFVPAYFPETLSSLAGGGYNMPSPMWTPGYDMSPGSSDFAGTMSDPAGGYTQGQTYGQGYITSPTLSFSSTMSNPLGVYTPSQQWGHEYNMSSDPSCSFGTLPGPTGGYTQNYQGDGSSFSSLPQQPNEGIQPNEAGARAPKSKPLRRLLPRDKSGGDGDDDDDDDKTPESAAYRAWLKSQAVYGDPAKKKRGSSSKGKSSGTSKHQSSNSHKSGKKKK